MLSSTECTDAPRTLLEVTSAVDFHAGVADLVRRIASTTEMATAVVLLHEATERMGADASAFVSFVKDDETTESYRFLIGCDPVMCVEYERIAWYADDPWLHYACAHTEPIAGSHIPCRSAQDRALREVTAKFGFASSLIVPAPASRQLTRVGVLCLGSRTEGYFEGEGMLSARIAARSLAMELHEWWIARVKAELVEAARLTPEDLALLNHEWRGHPTKKIAMELGTTPGSIDSRFQRLNAKLGVASRKGAARLAAEYGLL